MTPPPDRCPATERGSAAERSGLGATVGEFAARPGLQPAAGGRHPGLGTGNALLDLGAGIYLEIIGVDLAGPTTAGAPPVGPRPFGLDRIAAARLATWAARVDEIDERVASARSAGYDPGPVGAMSRRHPDGI